MSCLQCALPPRDKSRHCAPAPVRPASSWRPAPILAAASWAAHQLVTFYLRRAGVRCAASNRPLSGAGRRQPRASGVDERTGAGLMKGQRGLPGHDRHDNLYTRLLQTGAAIHKWDIHSMTVSPGPRGWAGRGRARRRGSRRALAQARRLGKPARRPRSNADFVLLEGLRLCHGCGRAHCGGQCPAGGVHDCSLVTPSGSKHEREKGRPCGARPGAGRGDFRGKKGQDWGTRRGPARGTVPPKSA